MKERDAGLRPETTAPPQLCVDDTVFFNNVNKAPAGFDHIKTWFGFCEMKNTRLNTREDSLVSHYAEVSIKVTLYWIF